MRKIIGTIKSGVTAKNLNRPGAGLFFEPARKLFKKCGFETCKPFAHYKEDINSIYYTKQINND